MNKKKSSEMPIGGMITTPGSSEVVHTGNWRAIRPVIDDSKCIHCLFCVHFCPENCIALKNDKRGNINLDYCKGCGICSHECLAKCIKMIAESEFDEKKCVDECEKQHKKLVKKI